MALTKEDILEAVGALTVLELNDLVKAFEEKFGVSAAAVAVDPADSNGLTYDVTLVATLGTALTTSTVLVQATSAEATAAVIAIPTGILENDIYIKEGTTKATATSVYHGVIFEDRNEPVPPCFKAVLPMIKFEKGV